MRLFIFLPTKLSSPRMFYEVIIEKTSSSFHDYTIQAAVAYDLEPTILEPLFPLPTLLKILYPKNFEYPDVPI